MKRKNTILVAPLNWGLGHATRCVPIIDELLHQKATVILASDGNSLALLKQVYPQLTAIELPSYNIQYKGKNMILNMAPQLPSIIKTISTERQELASIINSYKIDAVISDNRYGLHHSSVPCVFITHQLNLKMPYRWLERLIAPLNRNLIQKFDACWVPDFAEENNLSGCLSHPNPLGIKTQYIGVLSRMSTPTASLLKKQDICVVLSGPEPQRSQLEEKLIEQLKTLAYSAIIIGGQPQNLATKQPLNNNITYLPYLDSIALQKVLLESTYIICRSGYSTLMDLVTLRINNVLLIPTPGQTEQEYLATFFEQKHHFLVQSQDRLNISTAIQKLSKNKQRTALSYPPYNLRAIIEDFLCNLTSQNQG